MFLLVLVTVFLCLKTNSVVAKTCDEDEAEVVQVPPTRIYFEEGVSWAALKRKLINQAIEEAYLMVNPTQISIYDRSVTTASSSQGAGTTAQRDFSGSQISRKLIKTRSVKQMGKIKIIDEQGIKFLEGQVEVSVCKIEEEDIIYRVSVGPITWSGRRSDRYIFTIIGAFPEFDKIMVFRGDRGEVLSDVVIQGAVGIVHSRRNGSNFEIDARVGLTAHLQIEHRTITKYVRLRKKVPASNDELQSVLDVVDEAFEKLAVTIGNKLAEVLL
jgi:hypothetical protein